MAASRPWGRGFYGVEPAKGDSFVELDRHGGGVPDNLYQDVQTEAGQRLELSFSAMQRGADRDHIEVYWGGELVETVQPTGAGDWDVFTAVLDGLRRAGPA